MERSLREVRERQEPLFEPTPEERSLPELSLLDEPKRTSNAIPKSALEAMSRQVELKLADFGVEAEVVAVLPGPVVTRYELQLAPGIKVSKVTALSKDLARSLSTVSVRVVDVIPGKSVIGLEIPNEQREIVSLSEVLRSAAYDGANAALALALGKDISGEPVVVDLARMPHLLVAGTTGAGKSVAINAMVLSLLYKASPDDVRMIMIDPKMLELSVYEGIPHLLAPVVTDMKEAANALRWCVVEMERRYRIMSALGVRNIGGFNRKIEEARARGERIPDPLHDVQEEEGAGEAPALLPLPKIVVVIDELADLMMVTGKKVEELIARLAQKARASGIHLILATQRPSVDVITGLIKANIPSRIAFQVSSKVDSRTIIDQMGAEHLLGHGDMLYMAPGRAALRRVHGAFVGDQEVHRVVKSLKRKGKPRYIPRDPGRGRGGRRFAGWHGDSGSRQRSGKRSLLRRGGTNRDRDAARFHIRGAAPPQDRLQPGRAYVGADGGLRCRRRPPGQRQPRGLCSSAAGTLMRAPRSRAMRIEGDAGGGGARALLAAVFVGIGLMLLGPRGVAAQEGAVERLHRFFDETRSLSADFRQRLLDEEGRLVEESAGRVSLARPGKFRWVYREPFEQQIVGDGSQIWIYDADLDQVTVSEAASSIGTMPAMLLYSDRPTEDSFEVRALDARDGLLWVELLPRSEDSGFTALRIRPCLRRHAGSGARRQFRPVDPYRLCRAGD